MPKRPLSLAGVFERSNVARLSEPRGAASRAEAVRRIVRCCRLRLTHRQLRTVVEALRVHGHRVRHTRVRYARRRPGQLPYADYFEICRHRAAEDGETSACWFNGLGSLTRELCRRKALRAAARDEPVHTHEQYCEKLESIGGRLKPSAAADRRGYAARRCLPDGWTPCSGAPLTHLSCVACGLLLPAESFAFQRASKWRRYNNCRACESKETLRRSSNAVCFTRAVYGHMKEHSVHRKHAPPRWDGFEAFAAWWASQIRAQGGRCHVSGAALSFDFQAQGFFAPSPERLENEQGYSPENCVIICRAFQSGDASRNKTRGRLSHPVTGTSQWTREKFGLVRTLAVEAESAERTAWLDGQLAWAAEDLAGGAGWKQWRARRGGRRVCELAQWIRHKVADRVRRSRRLEGRMTSKAADVTIDARWILDAVRRTRLRCEYSNVQMTITPCSHWLCSFERVDNDRGYTDANTKLVCHEFNGVAKWSTAMVKKLWPDETVGADVNLCDGDAPSPEDRRPT